MFKINGIDVMSPTEFSWKESDISSEDAGRDKSGDMNKDIIARKITAPIRWEMVPWEETSIILNALELEGVYARLYYPDPKLGKWVEKLIYTNDRETTIRSYVSESEIYWDISVPNVQK